MGMTDVPVQPPTPTPAVQAGVPMVPGQQTHKGTLSIMWGGVWVPLGDAEFLVDENSRITKVISFTPKGFLNDPSGP